MSQGLVAHLRKAVLAFSILITALSSGVASSQTSGVYRLEVEDYSSMSGIEIENSWDDGQAVIGSWIDPGDYITFDLNAVQAGAYRVTFRYASDAGGGALSFFQGGRILGDVSLDATGGWGTWGESETTIMLESGAQTLMVFVEQGGWNLNWIELERIGTGSSSSSSVQQYTSITGTTLIEVEEYTLMSGVQIESSWDEAAATIASWINAGDYLTYSLDVDEPGEHTFTYRYASEAGGGIIHLFAGDVLIDVVELPSTGGWGVWSETQSTAVLPAGETELVVLPQQGGWNINWFKVSFANGSGSSASSSDQSSSSSSSTSSSQSSGSGSPATARVQADSYTSMEGVEVESSWDGEPATIVSWTDAGDYLSYTVDVEESGQYNLNFRYVSASGGGRLTILRGEDFLGVVHFPSTGGWGSWGEVEITVDLLAGENNLEFFIDHGGWNLNWFEVSSYDGASSSSSSSTSSDESSSSSSSSSSLAFRLEAEDFTSQHGIQIAPTTDESGGMDLVNIDSGDRAQYLLNVPVSGVYKVSFRVASEFSGYHFQFHDYSGLNEVVEIQGTGIENWTTIDRDIMLKAGEYTVFIDSISAGWVLNHLDFELIEESSEVEYLLDESDSLFTVEAENYVYNSGGELVTSAGASGEEALLMIGAPGWTGYHFTTPSDGKYRIAYFLKALENENYSNSYVELTLDANNGTNIYSVINNSYPTSEWSVAESLVELDRGGKSYNITNSNSGWIFDKFTLQSVRESLYSEPYQVGVEIPAEDYAEASSVYVEKSASAETGWAIRHIQEYVSGSNSFEALLNYPVYVENSGDYKIVAKALSIDGEFNFQIEFDDPSVEPGGVDVSNRKRAGEWTYFEIPVSLGEGSHNLWVRLFGGVRLDTVKIVPNEPSVTDDAHTVTLASNEVDLIISNNVVRKGNSTHFELQIPNGYALEAVDGCGAFPGSIRRGYGNGWWTSPVVQDCEINVILRTNVSTVSNIKVEAGDESAFVYWDDVENAENYDVFISDHLLTDIDEYSDEQGVFKFENVTSPVELSGFSNAQQYYVYVLPKIGTFRPWYGVEQNFATFIPSSGEGVIDTRFEKRPGGVVFDLLTGYEWKRCSHGNMWTGSECIGEKQDVSSGEDIFFEDPDLGWRAARVKELKTLVYCSSGDPWFWMPPYTGFILNPKCEGDFEKPTINTEVFPDVNSGLYLGDATSSYNTDFLSFNDGGEYYSRNDQGYVLLVKGPMQSPEILQISTSGSGTVLSQPEAFNCQNSPCNYWIGGQSHVVLTAIPDPGSEFSHWDGLCSGQDETCEINGLTQEESTTAYFEVVGPNRFSVVSPGVVWDRWTGMEWEQCAYGRVWSESECLGDETLLMWDELQTANSGRWRVPSEQELSEVIYCRSGSPSYWSPGESGCVNEGDLFDLYMQQGWAYTIDTNYFPGSLKGPYWTSTSVDAGSAISVDLLYGSRVVQPKNTSGIIYRVRDRETVLPSHISGEQIELSAQDSPFYGGDFVGYRWVSNATGEEVSSTETLILDGMPVGSYVYDLIAIDDKGQEYVESYVINVGNSPVVEVVDNYSTFENQLLTVDASNSYVEGGTLDFKWVFNGAVISNSSVLEYQFSSIGLKEIELLVTTDLGLTVSRLISVEVLEINESHLPTVIVPDSVSTMIFVETEVYAGDSHVANGTLTYTWRYNGQVVSNEDSLNLRFSEIGLEEVELTVTSSFGVSVTRLIEIIVSDVYSDFEVCSYNPVSNDFDYFEAYPDDDIPWPGGINNDVESIQRAFNIARAQDPSVHQFLLMPSQAEWDAMNLQEKGFYLVNAERVARGIKPYSGFDASIVDVAQDYSEYMFDNNLVIDHYYLDSTPFERMMSSDYAASFADGYLFKDESVASQKASVEYISPEAALVRSIYNWIYHDKAWYLGFGLESGEQWGHRKHLLQTGLTDNHGSETSEGVGGFGVITGFYNPAETTPVTYGGVTTFNTLDQGPDWDSSRIGTVDVSQAQGCIPYAISFPEHDPALVGLKSINIEPSRLHLALNQSQTLTIIGTYADGSKVDLTALGTLATNEASVVSVDDGAVVGLKPGPATVYAKVGGLESNRLYITVGVPVDVDDFTGTKAESVASYIAPNATLPEEFSLTEGESTAAEYIPQAMTIYTGLVHDRYGIPLSGVKVSFLSAQNFGSVFTNNEGRFTLAGPAGEQTAVYQKQGHVVVQRTRVGSSGQWTAFDDITLLERDSKKTLIDLTSGVAQIHESTPIVDEYGERRTTLIFNGVTSASIHSADGSVRPIESFEVSATDFETPESMPGDLPEDVAFTWAADLHVEGAYYTDEVHFDNNVTLILDNFLGFDVGEVIPVGNYNMRTALWEAIDNAVVVQAIDEDGDGLVDGLDYTGDALADDLNNNGSTADESVGIESYPPGKTLWWASVSHFSTKDMNQGQAGDESPGDSKAKSGEESSDDDSTDCTGSYLKAFQQTFHEDISIAGTNLTLHYASQRTEGYKHKIRVQVSGDEVPSTLLEMIARLEIAGHVYEQRFVPEPNVETEFIWDGTAVDGTRVEGLVNGKVSIGFEYQTMYTTPGNAAEEGKELDEYPRAWATVSDITTQVPGRDRYVAWQSSGITLKNSFERQLANGWSLSNVHEFVPSGKVYLGLGSVTDIAAQGSILKTGQSYSYYAGDDGYYQTGGQVVDYSINDENVLIDHVTGLEWQNERNPYRTVSKQDAANYCDSVAEPLGTGWRLPTPKEVGYTIDKSGGTPEQRVYSVVQARHMWHTNTLNTNQREIPTVCVRGENLDLKTVENLERNASTDVVVDQENGLMWQDSPDNVDLTLTWEESIDYCESSTQAGYDNWRLPNINELLFVLPNSVFEYKTILELPPGVGWNELYPGRNPYWSSTTNIQNERQAWAVESNSFNNARFEKLDEYHVRCVREDASSIRSPYRFDSEGRHIATVHVTSGVVIEQFHYDESGKLIALSDQFGNTTQVERNFAGVPERIVAPDGEVTWLTVDQFGDLKEVNYEDGSHYHFNYGSGGLLTSKIDPRDKTFTRQYDSNGRIEKVWDPLDGFWTVFDERISAGVSRYGYTTAESNTHEVVRTVLDNGDVQTSSTTKTGASIIYTRSADDLTRSQSAYGMLRQITSVLDPKTLQPMPQQVSVTAPSGLTKTGTIVKTYAENGADQSAYTFEATVNNKTSTVEVDSKSGVTVATSPEGRTQSVYTDPETLQIDRIEVPGLNATEYQYDSRGRVTELKIGNRITSYGYQDPADNGRLSTITAPDETQTHYDYDVKGRVTNITYHDGYSTQFEYDANGNTTKVTVPTLAEHDFELNDINLVELNDRPETNATTHQYDGEGRLTQTTLPSGQLITNIYENGKLARTQRPEGTTEYHYQLGDQLSEVVTGTERVSYSYDGTLLTQKQYQGELDAAINYTYNNDFLIDSLGYAGGTTSLTYSPDGLLTGIHGFTVSYNALNPLPESVADNNWSQSWQWNLYGEVQGVTYEQGTNTNFAYDLSYNQSGQIVEKTELLPDGNSDLYEYDYDTRNRLIGVRKNGSVVEEYDYDANGNRTLRTGTELGVSSQVASYNTGDQLQTQGNSLYEYDDNARLSKKTVVEDTQSLITTYQYDTLGRLKEVVTPDVTITYRHNALGNRVAKLVDGVVVEKYLWQDLTTLLATYDGQGNLKQRFEHTLGHTPTAFTQGGERYYIQTDHLGSPRVITDSNGQVVKAIRYDSFGNVIEDSNPSFEIPFGFAGGLYDSETGLIRFGYRDYDPVIGRWTARDPIGFSGEDTNLYGYVFQDPVNFIDRSGLIAIGNCDINVFTGKTVCSKTVGNEKQSCKFSSNGDISCKAKRGPLVCEVEYDSEADEVNWDYEISTPGFDWFRAKYEAAKLALEVGADYVESQAQSFIDKYNQNRSDAAGEAFNGGAAN